MADTVVTTLLNAIVAFKRMYDQHLENAEEVKEVQSFLEDCQEQVPALRRRFRDCDGNNLGGAALKILEGDISNVACKLVKYAKHRTFFSVFTSSERMQELQKLHRNVMASIQKNVGIASLSMLLDVREGQAEMQGILTRSTSELKSLVTTSIARMSHELAREVRAEVVQAGRTSFVENEKFWADVLAAVDKGETLSSSRYHGHSDSVNSFDKFSSISDDSDLFTDPGSAPGQSYQLYKDPITDELFIDPVNTSNGETYDRWTIIKNNMTKDPLNPSAALHILGDNISVRRALFDDFPEQLKKFRQCRVDYRHEALSLTKKGLIADAVLALRYVLQWDRNDIECQEALARAEVAMEDALHAQRIEDALPLHRSKPQIAEPAGILNPKGLMLSVTPYQQPIQPKSPMSVFSDTDHDDIWTISDRDSPPKAETSPLPEIFRPMKDIKTVPRAHSGSWVESVTYSPDGMRIATTGFDNTAKVWNAEKLSKGPLFILKGHKHLVRSCAWSPTGNELVTGSYDHTVKVWDTKTGEILYTLQGHQDNVNSVAWNPTGETIATGSEDGSAILWDMKSRDALATLAANIGPVSSVSWNPEGLFLAVAYKTKSIRVWDVTQMKTVFELKCEDSGSFNHVAWSPEGCEFAAASSNHTTVVCDAASGDVRLTLRGHSHEVMHVAWSRDGTRLATASKDKTGLVWNALTGAVLFPLRRHTSPLSSVTWRPDGVRVATASEGGSVTLWEREGATSTPPNAKISKLLSFRSSRAAVVK